MEDPFGPASASASATAQSSAPTSYTIMSPRAFSASPLLVLGQKGIQECAIPNSASDASTSDIRHVGSDSAVASTPTMSVTSPSTIMRPVSPPTPAPSPQPGVGSSVDVPDTANPSQSSIASHATPSHPGSVLMAHAGSAAMGEPGTPVSPGTVDAQGLAWGNPNVHIHPSHFVEMQDDNTFEIDPQVQAALFAEQFINSVVSHFPRLTGPERRTLFSSLLPYMSGEDLLHLSHLISPYLRRDFLAELPAEVALKILAYIDDPKDLMRASRVSRTWRSLVADEHNWKRMLEKYNGGGWSEARPALSSTPAGNSAGYATGQPRNQRITAQAQSVQTRINPHSKASSQDSRPSLGLAQTNTYGPSSSQISTSSPVRNTVADDDNINRFLQENQTPLANKTRKGKGRSQASDLGEGTSTAIPRDLCAAGSSESGMPGPSTSGTVGLIPAMPQVAYQAGGSHCLQPLRGLGVIPPRRGSTMTGYQASPSAASVLAAQQQANAMPRPDTGTTAPALPLPSSFPTGQHPTVPFLPVPPQDLTSQLQQLSLSSNAPPMIPSLSIPASTTSSTFSTGVPSSSVSPSATFAPAYSSPALPLAVAGGSVQSYSTHSLADSSVPSGNYTSPVASRASSVSCTQQFQSAPQPARVRISKTQNPFGTAQTNLTYTSQYAQTNSDPQHSTATPSAKPFSFKTQFKKAYLTESNWLKGPGRVLSRQTCTDDGVVTSLGFDNEWIIVGMATNQIHVFDAKTGAYVQQLVGHTLGVWCLVLVSKGGQRSDKDGKKVKSPGAGGGVVPSVFRTAAATTWDDSDEEDGSLLSDENTDEDKARSPTLMRSHSTGLLRSDGMERTRSASARPADRETFFEDGNDSIMSSPYLGVNDGSPRTKEEATSNTSSRRQSSVMPGNALAKQRRSNKRPSSFCGVPSMDNSSTYGGPSSSSAGFASNPSGFPFGGNGSNISPQQAAACGTAQGWGQPGAVAVSGGCDRDVRVWDVATGRCIHVLRGHLSTVRCLKVLDGRPIAVSGSRDNTLRVWDIERGVLLKLLSGHQHSVRCIEISGNKVASGSYDATCKIWDVDTGECLHTLQGHQHQIYAIAFDGNRVASGSLDSTVRIWSAKTGECLALLQGHTSLVGQLQLTDSLLVTGGSDGRVIVFSLSTFECLHRLCAHDNSVTCLQFNDRFMVTGGNDGRVKLWDRPTGKLIRDLAEPCEAVWRVTFREDKCVLLCKRGNRTIMEVRTFAPFDEEL